MPGYRQRRWKKERRVHCSTDFAARLRALVNTNAWGDSFDKLLKDGREWATKGWLITSPIPGSDVEPPLLSLAKYLGPHYNIFSDFLDLVISTGGFHSVLNDPKYAVVITAYQHYPNHLIQFLVQAPYISLVDWNIPDPSTGRTLWMHIAECQYSPLIRFWLAHVSRIDMEMTDHAGRSPNRLLQMNDDDRVRIAQTVGKTIGWTSTHRDWNNTLDLPRQTLVIAYDVVLPQHKTALKTVLQLFFEPILPKVLIPIVLQFLRIT